MAEDKDALVVFAVPRGSSTKATNSSPVYGGLDPTGRAEILIAILIFIYFGAFNLQQIAITTVKTPDNNK